jgi:hypothetical protein
MPRKPGWLHVFCVIHFQFCTCCASCPSCEWRIQHFRNMFNACTHTQVSSINKFSPCIMTLICLNLKKGSLWIHQNHSHKQFSPCIKTICVHLEKGALRIHQNHSHQWEEKSQGRLQFHYADSFWLQCELALKLHSCSSITTYLQVSCIFLAPSLLRVQGLGLTSRMMSGPISETCSWK